MRRLTARLAFAALAAAACACSSAATHFYTLSPLPGSPSGGSAAGAAPVLALGPVSLPTYVDRPQIVVRENANAVNL
ncbi:MAG: ABC-type transport auxiliary lipoprotein family protein, partial [bacterium]